MEKKYINESRYKKGCARKRRNSSTVKRNTILKNESQVKEKKPVKRDIKIKKKSKNKRSIKKNKINSIIVCLILLIIIAIISRAILKDENEPFIPLPFFERENDEVITIGVITEDTLLDVNTKNVVINEINKYSKDMLLQINEDYSITYKCISNITKVSNTEYILRRNSRSNVTANSIKQQLDSYRSNEFSVYYNKLANIDSITIIDSDTLNIKLKTKSPYFIYNLDICLNTSNDLTNYVQDISSDSEHLVLNRHEDSDTTLPAKVVVTKYKDMYSAVQAYKDNEINVFVTNSENVTNILGKYEYNIKPYRNGQAVFLFGNSNSKIYSLAEVRKAIAYGIDRDSIIKDILKLKGDKIDLPYIYDSTKYKYDVYAAENLLLTNGYKKINKVYSKIENGQILTLELNLIVNKEDNIKVSVANRIKNNLSAIGIKVNIEKLKESQLKSRIKNGTYDLVLASVNLNNTPDISFVMDSLYNTENVNQIIENINNSTVQDLNENIISLQNMLSEQVSAIGIYSDISYLIYSKDVVDINDVNYMNLFKGILN